MNKYNILIVLVSHRSDSAGKVQEVLSKFGCSIKVRVGLHETSKSCAEDGLIVLQLDAEEKTINELQNNLNSLDGVNANLVTM